jgi:hypothetical protein
MSIGPMVPLAASLAGSPLAQARGSEAERVAQENVRTERHAASESKAEAAAGVGVTDQEHAASDRDADGRRLWEELPGKKSAAEAAAQGAERKALDPTGEAGTQLDLSG